MHGALRRPGLRCRTVIVARCRWYAAFLERIPDDRLRVAVVGRPNVGKSTLFNRLTGRHAITQATPGVTRDVLEGAAKLSDLDFTVLDTPGMESTREDLIARAALAVRTADVSLFIIDVKAGVTDDDVFLSKWLRSEKVPVALVLNKADTLKEDLSAKDYRRLGMGSGWRISAEGSLGFAGIHRILTPVDRARQKRQAALKGEASADPTGVTGESEAAAKLQHMVDGSVVRLAIVGRPNAGKSTLFNTLLGEDLSAVGDTPGTTRDSVEIRCVYGKTKVLLADTAGLLQPKQRHVNPKDRTVTLEEAAHRSAIASIKYANVVVLLVDGRNPLSRFDIKIAAQVVQEGRCLVLAANKWDEVPPDDQHTKSQELQTRLQSALAQVAGLKCVVLSGKTGWNVNLLLDTVVEAYRKWTTFIPDAVTQRYVERLALTGVTASFMRYVDALKQVAIRPPTFLLTLTKKHEVENSQERWLLNAIRTEFGLDGVTLRLAIQSPLNVLRDRRAVHFKRPEISDTEVDAAEDGGDERKKFSSYRKAILKRAAVVGLPPDPNPRPKRRARADTKYRRALDTIGRLKEGKEGKGKGREPGDRRPEQRNRSGNWTKTARTAD